MKKVRPFLPLLLIFLAINTVAIVFAKQLLAFKIDNGLVIGGNCIIFFASILAFWVYGNAMQKTNGHGFVRVVYGGFVIKFFVLVVAAMVYFLFAEEINKNGVFVCLGLYLLYHFIGTFIFVKKQPAVPVDSVPKATHHPATHRKHPRH